MGSSTSGSGSNRKQTKGAGTMTYSRVPEPSPSRVLLSENDGNMPRMSGLELARACSRISCELCVLSVSGAHPDDQPRADLFPHLKAATADGASPAARKSDR